MTNEADLERGIFDEHRETIHRLVSRYSVPFSK